MRYAILTKVLVGFLALFAASCTGSGTDTASVNIRCTGGASFCLVSCDLGCTSSGCAVTEIAENQRLRFTFSSDIAVSSVNGSSISIRTATGVPPEGEFLVNGNEVTFVPTVRTVSGISTFGFQRNESYILTVAGGRTSAFGIRNLAGDTLPTEYTCTLLASQGIVDEDQQPPTVEMVAPTQSTGVGRDPTVILRFSELIDTTPLLGTLTAASPIRFTLRTAQNSGNGLVCDRDSSGLALEGIPRLSTEKVGNVDVTVVEFKPPVLLPGLACVDVAVTADLRDLSGRAATPNSFEFFTEAGSVVPITVTENFQSSAQLETEVSSGTWNNGARPGLLGGDGRHGSFDYTLGSPQTSTEYTFDTASVVLPGASTMTGLEYTITDGKFYFTDFVIPAGITVNFIGPVPPQIWVRGQAEIAGSLRLNGAAMTNFNARGATSTNTPYIPGQAGGQPGAGGGVGGNGGHECQGAGPIVSGSTILTNGQIGEDVRLLAGNGYAPQAVGTGGQGSTMNPASGESAPNTPVINFVYRAYFAQGGGGGGFSGPGGQASATFTPTNTQLGVPLAPGGVAFDIASFPLPGYTSLDHYTIGGSGGGGGATHAYGTLYVIGDTYVAGAGGSGGGGACAIRVGGDLTVANGASLQAKGGAGVLINGRDPNLGNNNSDWGICSPGGGGSGGSFLLQAGGNLTVGGEIDTSGGDGSRTGNILSPAAINITTEAGEGAPGFFRLESAGTLNWINGAATSTPQAYNAAINSGPLLDRDDLTGCTSLWYGTGQIFPPAWLHYELDVDLDGDGQIDVTYEDTGNPGTMPASDPNGPLIIQFQGALLMQSTGLPDPATIGEWRNGIGSGAGPGIGLDSPTGFRFMMTFNRSLYPNCIVRSLRVYARA